jgi:hypothetical protein
MVDSVAPMAAPLQFPTQPVQVLVLLREHPEHDPATQADHDACAPAEQGSVLVASPEHDPLQPVQERVQPVVPVPHPVLQPRVWVQPVHDLVGPGDF